MRKRYFRKQASIKWKQSIFSNRFFLFGILITIIFIALFYLICFCNFFQIEKIIVSGQEKVSEEGIKQEVEKEIERRILFFPSKSSFLINSKEIESAILAIFPQIKRVEINRGFPNALRVLVKERLEIGYWQQGEKCFLLDSEGKIFEEITGEIPDTILKIQSATAYNSGAKPELGQRVIEEVIISQILEIKTNIEQNLGILAKEVQIISKQRLNIKTSEGWEIYINPEKDINWQIIKLSLVLEKKVSPEKRKELKYIELRFGDLAPFSYR